MFWVVLEGSCTEGSMGNARDPKQKGNLSVGHSGERYSTM